MAEVTARPVGGVHLSLGEGPGWNEVTAQVSVVDILGNAIHVFRPDGDGLTPVRHITTPTMVGAALPLDSGDFLTAEAEGIFVIHPDDSRQKVADLPVADPHFRCNDAKIGPDGRLWVGVMHLDAVAEAGSLWAIDADGNADCLLEGLTIPNGMDWWGGDFWFVNGPTEDVRCYTLASGRLVDSGVAIASPGTPDGFTMDSDGNIWLAVWGGSAVVCLSQSGERLHTVRVPTPHPTSACFMGSKLVITSATVGLDPAERDHYPLAGDVFIADVPATAHMLYRHFGS